MGTRALIHVMEDANTHLMTMYRQNDGYPAGLGKEIKEILANGTSRIINGISAETSPEHFNGMGDLAAFLVMQLKGNNRRLWTNGGWKLTANSIGREYIYPPGSKDCGEDYTYTLSEKEGHLWLVVDGYEGEVFEGFLQDFDPNIERGAE